MQAKQIADFLARQNWLTANQLGWPEDIEKRLVALDAGET